MIKAPVNLQDLRRRLYVKAKAERSWRFWGLYVHVCKRETLAQAYRMARANNGAPGIDGVTFEAIEAVGVESFLDELVEALGERTYRPQRLRKVEIPKAGGGLRGLSIPTIRDRVVQGAMKLILEPIFEADFQPGSYGYRPKRSAHDAVQRVSEAIKRGKIYVIDVDLRSYFDNVRHHIVLEKVAQRVSDGEILHLLKLILGTSGKRGVPQGGVISPLLSNVYLNEVDKMLERAKEVTRHPKWSAMEYCRFADDLVVLVSGHPAQMWLRRAIDKRLREEFAKLDVCLNEEKSRQVNLDQGESFGFLGFEFRRTRSRWGKQVPFRQPQSQKRTALLHRVKSVFRRYRSQPIGRVIRLINPILRGWVGYFANGNSSRCFSYIRHWVEKKIRRHLARSRQRAGFGWKRWNRQWLYSTLGVFNDYRVRYVRALSKVALAG